MLTVNCAAIRDHDGIIFSIDRPARHHDVIHKMVKMGRPKPITGDQGFILSDGRFVEREEAAQIALAAGQCQTLTAPPRLYSEDLW